MNAVIKIEHCKGNGSWILISPNKTLKIWFLKTSKSQERNRTENMVRVLHTLFLIRWGNSFFEDTVENIEEINYKLYEYTWNQVIVKQKI